MYSQLTHRLTTTGISPRYQAVIDKAIRCAGIVALFFLVSIFAGCASYSYDVNIIGYHNPGARTYFDKGDFQHAATTVAGAVKTETAHDDVSQWQNDAIVLLLEQGAILRAGGQFEQSNSAFAKAKDAITYFDEQKPEISLSQEANDVIVNQSVSPYRGRASDCVMLATYSALDFLQAGQPEKARAAFNYADYAQENEVEKNRDRIEKAQEKLRSDPRVSLHLVIKANPGPNHQQYNEIKRWQALADKASEELETHAPEASNIAAYRNAYIVYLQSLYLMVSPAPQDHEHARSLLNSLGDSNAASRFVKQDLEAIVGLEKGKSLSPTTYVFFETGVAPRRIALPLFIPFQYQDPNTGVTQTMWYPAMYPMLEFQKDPDCQSPLQVNTGIDSETAACLANLDTIVAREFKDELPLIMMKAMICGAIKAGAVGAAYSGRSQSAGEQMGQAITQMFVGNFALSTNWTDLRTWSTLPKEIQVCRISTPQNRQIELAFPSTGQKVPVAIQPGTVNLILVKSINPATPPIISQVTLK